MPDFPPPDTSWLRLAACVALELTLAFAVAGLVARRLRPGSQQRTLWRLAFVTAGALLAAELAGLGHLAVPWLRSNQPDTATHQAAKVTVTLLPLSARPPATDAALEKAPSPGGDDAAAMAWPAWLPLLIPLAGVLWLGIRRALAAASFLWVGRGRFLDSGDLAVRAQALARTMGIRRRVRIRLMPLLHSPIAFGVLRPVIGVPSDFTTGYTEAQQDAMLAHELAHVAALDAAWIFAADLVTALAWWHPGAWWARRQLHAASEAAADEASLLVEDGPARLAESLVTLGSRLARSPGMGGLGMADPRFRSALGRRVERLLELRDTDAGTWRGPGAWALRLAAPILLASLTLTAAAGLLPGGPRAATLVEAWQRSPLACASAAFRPADGNDASPLILQSRELPSGGQTNPIPTAGAPLSPPAAAEPLHTRMFKLDTNLLSGNLGLGAARGEELIQRALNPKAPRAKDGPRPGPLPQPPGINASGQLFIQLSNHLASAGVDLQPPKAIHFNEQQSTLMVRGTLADLDLSEQALQVLNSPRPQIEVEVKLCEVDAVQFDTLGMSFLPGTNTSGPVGINVVGILNPTQSADVLRALEKRPDVNILTTPRILTVSRRQAQLKVVEIRNIVTDLQLSEGQTADPGRRPEYQPVAEPFELGPVVDLIPTATADGQSIHLTVIPTIKEFIGYDSTDVWAQAKAERNQPRPLPATTQPYPLPIFRLRQLVSSATVQDGQTLVLFSRNAKIQVPDGHPAHQLPPDALQRMLAKYQPPAAPPAKALLVFVTPTLVDAAGNALRKGSR